MGSDYVPQPHANRGPNKNELILYRLDSLDKSIAELRELVTQNARQEEKISQLECAMKAQGSKLEEYAVFKEKVSELLEDKKTNNTRWWQVLLLILSPIVSAIVVYALAGGFTK